MKWLGLALLLLAGCERSTRPPPGVEAYVWQSPDRPEVVAAIARATGTVETFHVRAAELRWTGDRFKVRRFLPRLPSPGCGLVVRIGASAARLEWTPERIEAVAKVFRECAELRPKEIQCDYDCPQKRLAGYRVLLDALQSAAGTVPVIPTALPSWLDEPDFRKLIAGRGGYVLQVHSLQLPERLGEAATVFDPAAARIAAGKAAALQVPFRIAMATYGCEVRFGADGKVTDVVSEDTSNAVAAERIFILADPVESARLVREWSLDPPAGLQGIVWYRLPVKGDRRNWPWETFQLVVRGETDDSKPELEATPDAGARDLFVANHGRFPVRLPEEIVVTSPVAAADGTGAYRMEARDGALHFIRKPGVWPWLDPGKKISTGWLRTEGSSPRIDWHTSP